jgi:hypothetical protein
VTIGTVLAPLLAKLCIVEFDLTKLIYSSREMLMLVALHRLGLEKEVLQNLKFTFFERAWSVLPS